MRIGTCTVRSAPSGVALAGITTAGIGVSVGGISVGGISVGGISVGGISVGGISVGGGAFGVGVCTGSFTATRGGICGAPLITRGMARVYEIVTVSATGSVAVGMMVVCILARISMRIRARRMALSASAFSPSVTGTNAIVPVDGESGVGVLVGVVVAVIPDVWA
jgi:hypothetical protein